MKSFTATVDESDKVQLISSDGEIFWTGIVPGAYAAAIERPQQSGLSIGYHVGKIDSVSITREQ